jgi:carbon storage regulator
VLVLTRRPNETIVITVPGCSPIYVTLLDVRIGKARIGVAADREVAVHRQEVQERVDRDGEKRKGREAA